MKIALLGGIGVEASCYAYSEVVKRIQNRGNIVSNTDYPQIIINSINAPELHLEEHDCDAVLAHYVQGVQELAVQRPDFIVMVCNTIHLFRDSIIRATEFDNILSIREIVAQEINKHGTRKVCVLGTGLTAIRGLYEYEGIENVPVSLEEQYLLVDVICRFNAGKLSRKEAQLLMFPLIQRKQKQGADTFLFACTEISEVLSDLDIPALDTLELLIDEVVSRFLDYKHLEGAA